MPEEKSKLHGLKPLIDKWPAVKKPKGHVHFRNKLIWTALCLILYFFLCNVMLFGVSGVALDMFAGYRAIMAGASGSIMHLGIGPIVTGSIIMQLFVGAKIIKLDLQKPEDRAIFQGTQKILCIVMILVEAVPQVFGYLTPAEGLVGGKAIIIAQLFMGGLIIFWMDELISKWGIGSGISLFIAAGVSQAIITGMFNWLPEAGSVIPTGVIPRTWHFVSEMSLSEIVGGGFEEIFIGGANPIIALLGTMAIFLFVVYAESSRIELPLTHARVRGARGRYPLRLIYASVIPVILVSALLANVSMFAMLFYTRFTNMPLIGNAWWIGKYVPGSTTPVAGGAWYLTRPNGLLSWLFPIIDPAKYGAYLMGHEPWQMGLRILIYFTVMVVGSIFFAKFWIATTNMGPEAVARQIQSSGMQIPGFRRDPRILKKVLSRYIPVITVISGATVGALAASADMIGTVGNTSGTGVLLTVGIMIHLYEEIAREQAMEMHPVLRKFFGAE